MLLLRSYSRATTAVWLAAWAAASGVRGASEAATVFEARTSGLCTDKSGWAWVGSQAECEEAARAKGWPDTDAEDRSYKKLTIRVGLMPNLSTVVSLGGKATVRAPW